MNIWSDPVKDCKVLQALERFHTSWSEAVTANKNLKFECEIVLYLRRAHVEKHVSRTHRVALDWLFDSISLDAGIHIKFADTTRQIADVLTEGCFAREQWDRLIGVFNIMDETTYSCSHSRSLRVQFDESMCKRPAQQEEEARSAGKSRLVRNPCAERTSLS